MNSVVLIGRLVKDVDIRFTASNMAVANFTIAVDKGLSRDKKAEFESQGKPTADFIRIVCWGKQAENASQYVSKGKMIAVNGSIQSSTYKTPQDEIRYVTEVLASRIEFLEWCKKETQEQQDDFSFGGSDFQSMKDDDDVPF